MTRNGLQESTTANLIMMVLSGLSNQFLQGYSNSIHGPVLFEMNMVIPIASISTRPHCNVSKGGCYFQAWKGRTITIGRDVYIANNVQIITRNHDVYNLDKHTEGADVIISDKCWIASNAVILPGVILGEGTIVAANAVVNKSFLQGKVIVGGIPAKVIKQL